MKIAVLCGGRSSERDVSLSTGIQVARALRETGHDVVLVDAPCSGMGGGTKPDAYLNRTENNVCELASLQQKILEACCRCVKPGGRLVYSTCTISKRENADTVQSFLMNSLPFRRLTVSIRISCGRMRIFADARRTECFSCFRTLTEWMGSLSLRR